MNAYGMRDQFQLKDANIQLDGDDRFFKIVFVREVVGSAGNYSANLQVSPDYRELKLLQSMERTVQVEMRRRYSQVRLTGHDFLDIGTGNFAQY